MRALVLTAGVGKRLRPLTADRSKSMLMIAGRPVLEYIIESLRENNVRDIVVVAGHGREEIMDYFEHGGEMGVRIRYVIQHEQKGVEHAILTAREELEGEEEFLLVNGDVLVEPEMVARTLTNHATMDSHVTMLVTLVSNPEQFGTVRMKPDGTVERLVEKGGPDRYVSNYAVAGVSVFNTSMLDVLEEHRTMEAAVEAAISAGLKVSATVWEKEWAEFTWPWDVLHANRIILDRLLRGRGSFIAESAELSKNVVLEGPVYIEDGAVIRPGVTLSGPVYVGKDVYVGNNSLIRQYTSLSEGVHIGYAVEVRDSMVFQNVNIGRMTFIADSIVGANTCIEAGAQLWNWRPDGSPFYIHYGEERVRIPLRKFGAVIGDNVVIGVNVSVFPGVRIGEDSTISAGCIVEHDIPPHSSVRASQKLIVEPKGTASS